MNTIHVTIAQGWFVGAFAIAIAAVLAAASFAVDDTASKKAAQFRDNMRKQLDTVERRLKSVQANLRAESEQAEKSLREKLDEARRELRAQKERVEQTQATLKARAQEKLTETEGAVSEWKAKRET
ncbi:MAG: hypothetical protein ACXVCF_20575, partial [Isosphaeraceae bacterium]